MLFVLLAIVAAIVVIAIVNSGGGRYHVWEYRWDTDRRAWHRVYNADDSYIWHDHSLAKLYRDLQALQEPDSLFQLVKAGSKPNA